MTMKRKANWSLALLALLFVCAAVLMYYYPGRWWPRMLLYTAEAGLVGALADLFAVTVLFRHPFGLRWVPHTAIIPRKRDKLIDGVAAMVEEQLLSKSMIKDKLMVFSLVDGLIDWVDRKPGERSVAERGWDLLAGWLRGADTGRLSGALDGHARSALRDVNLSVYAGKGLKWLLDNSNFQQWIGHLVDYAAEQAAREETKAAIRNMLSKEKEKFVGEGGTFSRWFKKMIVELAEATDAINLDDAANSLFNDLQSFMKELQNPEHELRILMEARLLELADTLETSDEIGAAIEGWKQKLLEELTLQPSIQALMDSMRNIVLAEQEMKYIVLHDRTFNAEDAKQWVVGLIEAYWERFKSDEATKGQLDSYLKGFVGSIIEQEHAVIGKIARKTLEGFTEERLVEFIEGKVDADLQRIRLNGAFIGAAVGALLFLFLHGVYGPLLNYVFGV